MNRTKIEYADFTWNPITGCTKGCGYCYARRIAERFRPTELPAGVIAYGPSSREPTHYVQEGREPFPAGFAPTFYPHRLTEPVRQMREGRIFTCSMGDLFDPAVPDDWRRWVFEGIMAAAVRHHKFLILTKRPGAMAEWARRTWWHEGPLSSVWLGTSITNQADADERIPHLLQTPAAVRWLSAEPLLGPVDIKFWLRARFGRLGFGEYGQLVEAERPVRRLHWVVIGARTGPSGSIPETSWVRNIIEDCRETETPVFVKDNVAWPERIRQFPRLEG